MDVPPDRFSILDAVSVQVILVVLTGGTSRASVSFAANRSVTARTTPAATNEKMGMTTNTMTTLRTLFHFRCVHHIYARHMKYGSYLTNCHRTQGQSAWCIGSRVRVE